MDWVKTTARRDEKYLSFEIWCDLYKGFYGSCYLLLAGLSQFLFKLFTITEMQILTLELD